MVRHSATLALNERVRARQAAGKPLLHLGFGEAGLPVLPAVRGILAGAVDGNTYGPVAGSPAAREAAAGYFTRRGLPTEPDQVFFAPGSKALLFGLIATLDGDVVLPVPSWVTYAAQVALMGKRVVGVPTPWESGGVPDPDLLPDALRRARADGLDPKVLVLTTPDNPTGTYADGELLARVCELADREGLAVISDEIYRDLAYEPDQVRSPGELLPERTFVTSGLSKQLALGGYRIGFARLPDSPLGKAVSPPLVGLASEVWSSLATPMQDVAAYVLGEPAEVTAHVQASRRLHQHVSLAVYERFLTAGATCRTPTAAFYLYPDFASLREPLAAIGIRTGAELADLLLDRFDIGVLAGEAFGDAPEALRFRVATSLLYGETPDERWAALASPDPTACPWIAHSLDRVAEQLAALADHLPS